MFFTEDPRTICARNALRSMKVSSGLALESRPPGWRQTRRHRVRIAPSPPSEAGVGSACRSSGIGARGGDEAVEDIIAMIGRRQEMEFAIEVFVRGHSVGRSRTHPYEASRVGPLWVMRDAPRKNPRDYRKEEWIAHGLDAREVDAIVRRHTRGRFFVCAMLGKGEPDQPARTAYKTLGYRLLATEGFFVHRLERVPRPPSVVSIERVRTPELAARLGKVTRTRPIPTDLLGETAP